ncbi:hypothetical protein DRN34_03065 [Thermococci archaeon]|nr:MAG: hypothetical protein DRN34_03065 [Thermococci archaeon]
MFVKCHTTVDAYTARNRNAVITSYKGYDKNLIETIEEVFKDNKDIIKAKIEHRAEEEFEYGHF